MDAVPVVEVIPHRQCGVPLLGVLLSPTVRPLAQRGLAEALGLAIGLRSIDAGEPLDGTYFKERGSIVGNPPRMASRKPAKRLVAWRTRCTALACFRWGRLREGDAAAINEVDKDLLLTDVARALGVTTCPAVARHRQPLACSHCADVSPGAAHLRHGAFLLVYMRSGSLRQQGGWKFPSAQSLSG